MARVIKLSDKADKFSFTVDSKELDTAITKAGNVIAAAQTNQKNFLLLSAKNQVVLIAYNPDTFVYIILKSAQPKGDGAFGFAQATLQGLIKGRGEIKFMFSGTECSFKASKGNYEGKIVTLPITSEQISVVNQTFDQKKDEKGEGSVLPRHVLDHLKEGVALTGIKDVYTGNALLAYMMLSEKGILVVSSHDNHHFGHYKCKVQAGGITFKAALPSSHFAIIDKMVEEEEAKFFIRSSNIKVEGENFVLILPATQADDKNFDLIGNYIKDLEKPTFECAYDHGKFTGVVENLFTLHSVNTSFEIKHEKKTKLLSVAFNTSNGSAKDSVKIEPSTSASVSAKVDPRMLRDIILLLKTVPEVTFSIIKDKVIRLSSKTKSGATVSLISALSG